MCTLFSHQPQRSYAFQTRARCVIGGSVYLDPARDVLLGHAGRDCRRLEGMSLAKFLTKLHNEVLELHGEVNNFASLLRCSCMIYRTTDMGTVIADLRDATSSVSVSPAE